MKPTTNPTDCSVDFVCAGRQPSSIRCIAPRVFRISRTTRSNIHLRNGVDAAATTTTTNDHDGGSHDSATTDPPRNDADTFASAATTIITTAICVFVYQTENSKAQDLVRRTIGCSFLWYCVTFRASVTRYG